MHLPVLCVGTSQAPEVARFYYDVVVMNCP